MIAVTRPDGTSMLLNPDRIESIEQTPDTVITLVDGRKLLVREDADHIAAAFTAYRQLVQRGPSIGEHLVVANGAEDRLAEAPEPEAAP